jgi:P2 family phage contractile tail tube protein
MAIDIKKLTNANVYIDGKSAFGKAEEITLPEITGKMAEHKALGMVGSVEFFAGLDKMDCKIKWAGPYADIQKKAANFTRSWDFQVRGSLESHDSTGRTAQDPYTVFMTGTFKKHPGGGFKQHDNVEMENMVTVTYIKLVVAGETIYEIDVLANIYRVAGEDLLATYRANLGL